MQMTEIANPLLVARAIISHEDRLLLVQRAFDNSHNAGGWEFPGGKVDASESVEQGLCREVNEETGLIVEPLTSIVHVENRMIESGKYQNRLYVALFFATRLIGGELLLSDEHGDANWVPLDVRLAQTLTPESSRALEAFVDRSIL